MSNPVCQTTLAFHSHTQITARFDGGNLTSDAGWLLFGSLDRQDRLCEDFSSCIADSRDQRYVRHEQLKLIRQRVFQIVAGYEDCNDADTLRSDPMLKTVCDQLPESDPDLATQATFSRLENSVSKKDLMRLSRGFLQRYVRSLKKRRPDPVILDLDSTDDHTHGQQEFSFYHGYYRNHILHPLLIFDAVTGDLVTVVLRPGNKGAASHIVPILKRIVKAIRREVGKELQIEIRADSGFATPRLYEFCESEENKLQYVIGLSRNPRLQRMVEPMLESTRLRFDEFEEKQRQFDEFLYRAGSWDRFRRVIVKVEVDHRGINRRFVVTNRDDLSSQSLYDHYTDRGQSENFIKAFKNHLSMDRLSCHRFLANQFRLLLHGLAYQMFVRLLLDLGANPVPYEVAAQYHDNTYHDWMGELHGRGHASIAETIEAGVSKRYGPLADEANIRQVVAEGDVDLLRTLVAEKPERFQQVDAVGNTPLHVAVWANNSKITRLLIECGAPIDARNGDGRTPSVVALFGFHRWWRNELKQDILDLLMEGGADYTLLMAATLGDEARVRELLANDHPTLANDADPCHRRPLAGAASRGHTEVVRLLLENGADPNAKEAICQGGLALHVAVWRGYDEIVRLLLESGANPTHFVDSSGDSMFAAYHQGQQRTLQLFYAYGGTMEFQVYSAAHRIDIVGEMRRIKPALADEVLPYGWNDDGNEDLAHDIMQLAIRYGARFENASEWKLRWTVRKYPQVFRLLQEHGANPDMPLLGIAGDQPRRWPNPDQQRRVVAFLVEECNANINCRNEEGLTPLALAAREGQAILVDYFLARGATLNPDAPDWGQPLALAERHGHEQVVLALKKHGISE